MAVTTAIDLAVRALAFAGVVLAGAIAGTYWAVRRGRLGSGNPWFKGIRALGDPLLQPIETRVVRRGGNPQDATLWLVGIAVVGGLLLITATRWIIGFVFGLLQLSHASPSVWLGVLIGWAFGFLMLAVMVRVFAPWFGAGRFNRWVRPAFVLTDWLVEPIRRVMPPRGMFDWSPLVAYLVLYVGRTLLLSVIR